MSWGLFIAANFFGSISPGPNNITSMAMARNHGLAQSIKYAVGVLIGFAMVTFACCAFNNFISGIMPSAKKILAVLGALYFVYLAIVTLLSKPSGEERKYSKPAGILTGIAIQFINPHAIFFALSVTSVFVTPYFSSYFAQGLICVGMGAFAMICVTVWGVLGMVIQKFFSKYSLPVNIALALMLLYCAFNVFMGMFK